MERNSVFDNAKLLMVCLVVFGHLIEQILDQSDAFKTIYQFIYSFHIPVFIIVAGALTKIDASEVSILKNIKTLLIPFLVFTFLYDVFNAAGGEPIGSYLLNWEPYWILWFLLSMFIWKSVLPMVMQFKFPLLLSLVVSLCAGYIDDVGYFLGISRTLYFFPIFILGHQLGPLLLSNRFLLEIPRVVYFSVLILNVVVFWIFKDLPYQWLYGSFSYARIGSVEWFAFSIRAIIYLITITSSLAILMLMPKIDSIFSKRGKNSLYVYVWHGFFIKAFLYFGVVQAIVDISHALAILTLLITAILITAFLSCDFIANQTKRFLFLPVQRMLLIKTEDDAPKTNEK